MVGLMPSSKIQCIWFTESEFYFFSILILLIMLILILNDHFHPTSDLFMWAVFVCMKMTSTMIGKLWLYIIVGRINVGGLNANVLLVVTAYKHEYFGMTKLSKSVQNKKSFALHTN